MVERIDKSRIAGLAGTDLDKYVESDFKIRSGMCPNGHGLMTPQYFTHTLRLSAPRTPSRSIEMAYDARDYDPDYKTLNLPKKGT